MLQPTDIPTPRHNGCGSLTSAARGLLSGLTSCWIPWTRNRSIAPGPSRATRMTVRQAMCSHVPIICVHLRRTQLAPNLQHVGDLPLRVTMIPRWLCEFVTAFAVSVRIGAVNRSHTAVIRQKCNLQKVARHLL